MASVREIQRYLRQQELEDMKYGNIFREMVDKQRKEEYRIIHEGGICPLEKLEDRISTVDNIEKALQMANDDSQVLKTILCMNNILLLLPPQKGRSAATRHYLQHLQQIGDKSAEGYAMTADVHEVTVGEKLFVLKAPRKPYLSQGLLHEYFIGAYGTNQLRNLIPTFSYIFGSFQCSPPYFEDPAYLGEGPTSRGKEEALTYCQNKKYQVNYVLYENIKGVSLHKYVQTAKLPDYLSILIQIIFAIQLAFDVCGFSHNDLHDENVLVVELPEPITIRLKTRDGYRYLRTRVVAKIIDYGRSHITYKGKHYGYSFISSGIYPDRAFPLADIYKLLMFDLTSMAYGDKHPNNLEGLPDQGVRLKNPDLYNQIKTLITYFWPISEGACPIVSKGTSYLSETRSTYYTLPDTFIDKTPLDFFLQKVNVCFRDVIAQMVTEEPRTWVFGCSANNNCQTEKEAIQRFTSPLKNHLQDPYIFYDALNHPWTQRMKLIREGKFYFDDYVKRLLDDEKNARDTFERNHQKIVPLSLVQNDRILFQPQELDQYRRFIARVVAADNALTTLAEIERIFRKIWHIYSRTTKDQPPLHVFEVEPAIQNQMDQFIQSIRDDGRFLQSLKADKVISRNPKAEWLFTKMPTLIYAIQ